MSSSSNQLAVSSRTTVAHELCQPKIAPFLLAVIGRCSLGSRFQYLRLYFKSRRLILENIERMRGGRQVLACASDLHLRLKIGAVLSAIAKRFNLHRRPGTTRLVRVD